MTKRILLFCCGLVLQLLEADASDIVYSFPDGWQNQNMTVVSGNSVWECANEEIIAIPPYYNARREGHSYWGTSIITTIRGAYDPNNGWMVNSRKYDEGMSSLGSTRSTPTDYVTDIVGGWSGAFKGCTNTKKIILPPTILNIGQLAFDGCSIDELVCMAVTPPQIEEQTFSNVTISKIVVPKGTMSTYKSVDGWKTFNIVEGAEAYSEYQMVEHNGAWYEIINEKASLVNSDDLTVPEMPLTLNCLIQGEQKTIPITSIQSWSVGHDIVLNANITEIPENWRDGYSNKGVLTFSTDNQTFCNAAPNVITNKSGRIAYYIFNDAIVPHGVTTIANGALKYCTTAYLPTTLSYIGLQTNSTTKLHFTSERPPETAITQFKGSCTAPMEYISNYTGVFNANGSEIPAGYEYIGLFQFSNIMIVQGYWNTQNGNCILNRYSISDSDYDNNGVLNLPSNIYFTETMQGPIVDYNIYALLSGNDRVNDIDKLAIPEGVRKLTRLNCSRINEIYLPSTLEQCGSLSEIGGLKVIKVDPNNSKYDSRNNCNAVIETATNTLVSGNCGTTFPNTLEHIGEEAFMYTIGFSDVVTIPDNIKSIGKRAFMGIGGETVNYQNKPVQISFSQSSTITFIEDSTFYESNINKVIFPQSLISIGTNAFGRCSKLTNVEFGNSLKKIGDYSFYSCCMTSLSFPDALNEIGDFAFSGIPTLENVNFGLSLKKIGNYSFSNAVSIQNLTFNSSLQTVGEGAFSNCGGLESVIFPNSIKKIGDYAFSGCNNIQNIVFPMDSIESIGREALYSCYVPEELHLPSSLTEIFINSFNLCNLKRLYTDSPAVIDSDVELTNLEKVVIGNRKKSTDVFYYYNSGKSAIGFPNCPNLTEVVLGDSVETIGNYAFKSVPITSINIPKSLKKVGRGAFTGCHQLIETKISDIASWCTVNFESGSDSEISNPLTLTHKLIVNDHEITDLVIPDGVAVIIVLMDVQILYH